MTTPALIVARSLIKTRALTWSISTSTIALWSCLYVNIFWMIALWMRIRNTSENCNRSCKSHNYCETENDWLLHNCMPLSVSSATYIVIIIWHLLCLSQKEFISYERNPSDHIHTFLHHLVLCYTKCTCILHDGKRPYPEMLLLHEYHHDDCSLNENQKH